MTFIDGQNQYTTHYVYDNPQDPRDKVGEIVQMTEACGIARGENNHLHLYPPTERSLSSGHRDRDKGKCGFLRGRTKWSPPHTIPHGNITSREETGYVLINGTPTQRTYTTEYVYNQNIPGPAYPDQWPKDDSDITTFEYYDNTQQEGNNRGQLKAIVNALSQRTEFSNYDANGNVGKIKDPNNVETEYTYDERNRIKTIENLTTNALTEYSYDARGNLSSIVLPEGNQIDFTYNLANKLTEIKDSLDNKIQYQYDVEGNRSQRR